MKTIILLLILSVMAYTMEIVDDSQYADEIIGSQNLIGAKFLGEKIWQDQPINAKKKYMTFYQAKKYCKNLKLLGLNKWTLPTRADFKMLNLDSEENMFFYSSSDYYVTNPSTEYDNQKKSVRCVLNPNIYNKYQKKFAKLLEKKESLTNLLNAFKASGNKIDLQKAINLAKSDKDKRKIEKNLVEYLRASKILNIQSNKEIISKDVDKMDGDLILLNTIQHNKNLKHVMRVSIKKDLPFQIKYNTYKIKIRFLLELTYKNVMKKAMFGIDYVQDRVEKIPIETTFILAPKNKYTDIKTVDFGSINQGGKSTLFIFTSENSLEKAQMEYDILSLSVI